MRTRRITSLFAGALIAFCGTQPVLADFPTRPVTLIVPVAAGASPDVVARHLAHRLSEQWKQQVLVLNRPGGSGITGALAAMQSPPDGYTLYMPLSSAFAVLPESKTKLPVDLATDFATIGLISDQPMVISATPKLGVNTLAEFIALAKKKPGEILYGATRLSVNHLTGAYLEARAGIKMGFVPTFGAAKVLQDIMSGNLHVLVDSPPGMASALRSGDLKALAVASDRRIDSFPDVPLVSDTLPNFEAKGWYALLAPAKTPEAVVKKLRDDLRTALRSDDLRQRFLKLGTTPRPLSIEETNAFIKAEQEKWRPIVRRIQVE